MYIPERATLTNTRTYTHTLHPTPPTRLWTNEGVRYPSRGPGSHRKWSHQIRLSTGQMRGISGKRRRKICTTEEEDLQNHMHIIQIVASVNIIIPPH